MSTIEQQQRRFSQPLNAERLIDDCRRAIEAIDVALELPPRQVQQKMGRAKQAVVRLRDDVIDQLRQAESPYHADPIRLVLDQINVVLSLIVAVEYPAGGIQRTPVEQSRDLLQALLDETLRQNTLT